MTIPLRVVVADDEAPARARIGALISSHPTCEIVGEAESGPGTLQLIARLRPDLVFLDVHLPGLSGIEVWRRLPRDERPVVVFTTAYDRYAIDAFEARAIDYLLKPFTDERFGEALSRAERLLAAGHLEEWKHRLRDLLDAAALPDADASRRRPLERFAVRTRDRLLIVAADDVDWIEAARDYARLHVGTATHLVRATMQGLEERLDPERFLRVHRSSIVQLDSVVGLEPYSQNEDVVVLKDGSRIMTGRTYRTRVRERLGV